MKTVIRIMLHSFIRWLRRPERFIQKLQAIYPRYAKPFPFHNHAEDRRRSTGRRNCRDPVQPKIEGATTQ
jgi:hypothetical protein